MVSLLADSLRNFLPTLLLLNLIQQDSLLRSNHLLNPHLLLIYHRDVLIVAVVILAGVHQLPVYLLALLQEVGGLLEVVQLELLVFDCPAGFLGLEGG